MSKTDKGQMKDLHAVIMAGGKGTRFWPLSREALPKQFLKLVGDKTLLQDTINRLDGAVLPSNVHIVITRSQKTIVQWQAGAVSNTVNTVVEPEGRNTAPAIALVSFKLFKKDKNALMLVLPSDHYVSDRRPFQAALRRAVPVARKGAIVTFGIKPTRPETGFGYIKTGGKLAEGAFGVAKFVEKPDLKTAKAYLKQGSYYWNSGMFLFRAADMIEELKAYMPELHEAFLAIYADLNAEGEQAALAAMYGGLKDESIDYGVMEKSKRAAVVVSDFPWSDIGSWNALDDVMKRDEYGNVMMGNVEGVDCQDSIFFAGDKLVAAIGLKDMVVVDTADATLITPKSRVQQVKELVGRLKQKGKGEYLAPSYEERPWGYFSVLEQGKTHKIKHIYLKPKAKLSFQMHNHRSEHWIVVSGSAKVYRGDEAFFVHQNESTFIPATVRHSLENPGMIPLRIVEIQSGEYLGEDDIIRFDDIYNRDTEK